MHEDFTQPAIRYEHVTKSYDGKTEAVKDLSVSVEQRDFVMLVGSSGGGKTTLLKMANGLIEPTSGDVCYCGTNLKQLDLVELRRHIGYSIQGSVLFPHLSVKRNIEYVPRLLNYSRGELARAVTDAVKLVGLDESLLQKSPNELSGGQQQRVGIARALAARPHVLLMDEPFGAVDAITRRSLQEEIARIHEERELTILFVTHDINEAMRLGTKILVIDEGVMQQYGTPDELVRNPATPYVEQLLADVVA